ncbi:DUF4377 domain-containing protein [Christiangramia forsetii]|uniref:DUF4377 domain-containing protein n=2 Tax=Christiangramia forsetii TaxID=411153 RepID=A0M080_CHRFK|nr:DUF4377 domain-containing protein [Christiangramia forsetii]GGG41600.1 hypothetical protein GCM10011532_26670 [Christiangramia forsetii]CAL66025.1 conserved hypothetical protein, membrane or secreted [Christiangramia forsetii KT0803]
MHIKFNSLILIGFFTFFGMNSCNLEGNENNEGEVVRMRVNHFKQTAFGVAPQLVLLVQEAEEIGGEEWNYFYDGIKDFEYEYGYVYDISVKKEPVENPPQDASSIKYILLDVISKEKIDNTETFEIKLKWGGNSFVSSTGDQYTLMDELLIDCNELCENLAQGLENEDELTGTFSHVSNGEIRLITLQ